MNNIHIVDLSVIIIYLFLCLIIGLYKVNTIKTIRDYTLGVGAIPTSILLFTIFATHMGAGTTVGTVGELYADGLLFAIAVMFRPLFWVLTAKIFANNAHTFKKAGCISVSDIMGLLYGKLGKWVTNVLSVFLSIGVIAVQIGAVGYLFNYFLGISHALGVIIGFGVVAVYSVFGGVRAVSLTDTFQGLILIVAIPVACILAFHDIGGYDALISSLPETHLSLNLTKDNALLLASLIFYTLMPVSEGTFIQRFLMANDKKQLNKTLKIIAWISLPFTTIICLIGFVIKVKAPEIDHNTAFFYLVSNYLPVGITGFLIAGILAAIMSTADSYLNTAGVLCAHDIAKGIFPKLTDKQELFIARCAVLVISAFAISIAISGKSLMALVWFADVFWMPIIFIPLAAGFLKFKTNYKSFIASMFIGLAGTFLGKYVAGEFATISLLFGVIGSGIGLFGMHWWQRFFKTLEITGKTMELETSKEAVMDTSSF
jgi:Na+/proline symporter